MSTKNIFNFTIDEYEVFKKIIYDRSRLQLIIAGVPIWVNIGLLVFGVIFNSLNVIVFTRPSMKSVFNFLLTILEGVNIVLYLTMIPNITVYLYPILMPNYYFILVHHINQSLLIGAACVSNWLTVTVSVFRFIAVTWPLASVSLCSKRRAWYAVISLIPVSAIIVVTCLSLYHVVEVRFNVFENSTFIEEFRFYSHGVNLNLISKPVAFRLVSSLHIMVYTLPCLLTVVAILALLVNLWGARKKRKSLVSATHSSTIGASASSKTLTSVRNSEEKITVTLLIVIVLQLVAHVPTSIVYALIFIDSNSSSLPSILMELESSKFLVLVSNCATFIVYFAMSKRFRVTLTRVFGGKAKSTRKDASSTMYVSDTTITSHL